VLGGQEKLKLRSYRAHKSFLHFSFRFFKANLLLSLIHLEHGPESVTFLSVLVLILPLWLALIFLPSNPGHDDNVFVEVMLRSCHQVLNNLQAVCEKLLMKSREIALFFVATSRVISRESLCMCSWATYHEQYYHLHTVTLALKL
jgi:hypothetical protein